MLQGAIPIDETELAALCRKYDVAELSLFGSALRDDFDPSHSDMDMLVEFAPGARKSLFQLIAMQHALSRMFGRQVDLTTPGSISKYFRDDVLNSAVVIYDAA